MKILSVVIPFLNEENTIEKMLDTVLAVDLSPLWYEKEILLVNDGSTDWSEKKVQELIDKYQRRWTSIKLLSNDRNYWKGYSIKRWFNEASGDLLIIQDADMEYDPSDYLVLIKHLEDNKLDFVYGSRILWMKAFHNSYSTKSFLFGWLAVSIMTSILAMKKVTDEPTCYKLYKKELKDLLVKPEENWFEWEPAATMILLRKWFRYWEMPIHYFARKVTEWKKIKWKDWIIALYTLLKWRFKKI